MKRRKRQPLSKTVHPDILERAKIANTNTNEHLAALREMGLTKQGDISLETSVLLVETASLILEIEKDMEKKCEAA